MIGGALVHQTGRTGRKRTVHDVAVAGDPAAVRRAPVNVFIPVVEHPLESPFCPQVVTGGGVPNAFRLARAAGRVQDEERRFAIERLGRKLARLRIDNVMPPMIATLGHRYVVTDPFEHQAFLHRR